ncbi:allantoin permease [Ophiostoma piceae UAMH 11346]|uniref:Allantoin permease n=1 Tax=Ophiostoma piceae (strain UAMH 11346) TaxID=1262450 RepID=S3BUA0_OPHP1|nr:allantoin permease [Ophiostoma piceae UAMH 11346]
MATFLRSKAAAAKEQLRSKSSMSGWVLPKQESSWAPAGTWTNADLDIVPPSLRTWTSITILGYWMSDVVSVQSWTTGSSILAVGLTWSPHHASFPVLARSSFGYYFSRFPILVRLVTCLFWAAITNYYGIFAMMQVIRSIWPQCLDMPNQIPESIGITSQEMVAYFVFWAIETPLLLIPPYKLRWFFVIKVVMTTTTVLATVIWICVKANGSGDIWKQTATVSGADKKLADYVGIE